MDVKVGTPVEYHPFVTDLTPKGLKGKITLVHEGNPRDDSRVGTVDILLENDQVHLNVPLGYAAGKSYASPVTSVTPQPPALPKVTKLPAQVAAEQALITEQASAGTSTIPSEEKTPAQIYAEQQAAMRK